MGPIFPFNSRPWAVPRTRALLAGGERRAVGTIERGWGSHRTHLRRNERAGKLLLLSRGLCKEKKIKRRTSFAFSFQKKMPFSLLLLAFLWVASWRIPFFFALGMQFSFPWRFNGWRVSWSACVNPRPPLKYRPWKRWRPGLRSTLPPNDIAQLSPKMAVLRGDAGPRVGKLGSPPQIKT